MKQFVPQQLRRHFSDLLDQLDGTGDADHCANCTRIMTLALINRLPPVERVITMDFLNQYADRSGLS